MERYMNSTFTSLEANKLYYEIYFLLTPVGHRAGIIPKK